MEKEMQYAIKKELDKVKGEVCKEFEKVCQTPTSLHRMIKEMHNIFEIGEKSIINIMQK